MNTKKSKNKNKTRSVNPNPTQIEEIINEVGSEDIVEEKPEVVIKSDKRVPEIISEALHLPHQEKGTELDTPKKPKRNRGKKKKSEKADDEELEATKSVEGIIGETIIVSKDDKKKDGLSQTTELTKITPTARKKKNKNIKHSEFKETKLLDTEQVEVGKEDLKSLGEQLNQETLFNEPLDAEIKVPKKKNKKKKRNDSEKSEKIEEKISCTEAFQKILEPREDKKDVKEEKTSKTNKHADIPSPKCATDKPINKIFEQISTQNVKDEIIIELTKEDHDKSKQKDMKEKYPKADIEQDSKVDLDSKTPKDTKGKLLGESKTSKTGVTVGIQNVQDEKIGQLIPEEHGKNEQEKKKEKSPVFKEDIKQDSNADLECEISKYFQEKQLETKQMDLQTSETGMVLEKECMKSKAKIAKPVEKKRTNKVEELTDIVSTSLQEKEGELESKYSSDVVKQTQDISKVKEELNIQTTPDDTSIEAEIDKETARIDAIQAPTGGMGKKRKKSPQMTSEDKVMASEKIKDKTLEIIATDPLQSNLKDSAPKAKTTIIDSQKTEKPKSPTLLTEIVSSQSERKNIQKNIEEHISPKSQAIPSVLNLEFKPKTTQSTDDKKGKNKKKSPKMPKKIESAVQMEAGLFEPTHKIETLDEKHKVTTDSPTFTPLLEDIELTSINTDESERSVRNTVPDVQYSQASTFDNNNNIVIQDITAMFTEKLDIPVNIPDTPFITGPEETPIITPEVIAPGITVTEINTVTVKPCSEKTDLKSKVMEVNKDMEDLRLSIERSLAELNAIEKSEQEVEKQFEDRHNKTKAKETNITNDDMQTKIEETQLDAEVHISQEEKTQSENIRQSVIKPIDAPIPPVCPARKDNKGKGKSKKKGKQDVELLKTAESYSETTENSAATGSTNVSSESKGSLKEKGKQSKQKPEQEKGKQQCESIIVLYNTTGQKGDFEPIENFEDAMTSSAADVNKSFEMIANEDVSTQSDYNINLSVQNNPEINITSPTEEDEKFDNKDKISPVSQPKNLLGHPDIPARLNKTDYKKEKHKTPNARQARVNIKDFVPIDKESKESQTEFKRRYLKEKWSVDNTVNCTTSENADFIYKYSFRKVFLPNACHVCKKELNQSRVPCGYCNLVFYCCPKHKDEDYTQHQEFCFAVSTIVQLKNQKYIYADAQNITGHDYRLLRMQMIVSCEKVLKRKLTPYEQETLLYPRICADAGCKEWRQSKLKDCDGCGQISFCTESLDHFPKSHQRWCKSYALYQKLVTHQQTRGRLEPLLPSRVATGSYQIQDKINEVLASMYKEKIDMNDIQYASLTQIATAPLTAVFCQQLYTNKMNSTYANGVHKKSTYTLHVVDAELQFEADALNKWEVFFLHLRPDVAELRVVLIGQELNPSNLPLELLGKIRLCENCRQNKRRVIFDFQDGKSYQDYWSTDFITPDIVCAFNPSIQRSSIYNGKDHWVAAIKCILKLKVPFVVTSYTLIELHRDLARIKEVSDIDVNVISEPNYNTFASVRPDRNFISDDVMPLLFKNYCFMLISGAL